MTLRLELAEYLSRYNHQNMTVARSKHFMGYAHSREDLRAVYVRIILNEITLFLSCVANLRYFRSNYIFALLIFSSFFTEFDKGKFYEMSSLPEHKLERYIARRNHDLRLLKYLFLRKYIHFN